MYPALPPARDTGDAVDPAAGAALAPEADPATADPGPGPTPDPSPALPGTRRPRPSLSPAPDRDPGPGPSPSPSLGPGAAPLPPKEDPGPDLKASPSQQQRMEESLRSAEQISSRWDLTRRGYCAGSNGILCSKSFISSEFIKL